MTSAPPVILNVENDEKEKCPQCNRPNSLEFRDVISMRQHLWAYLLCCICCCLCWIPYASSSCKFQRAFCKRCGYVAKDTRDNSDLKIVAIIYTILGIIGFIGTVTILILVAVRKVIILEKSEAETVEKLSLYNEIVKDSQG